MGAIDNAGLLIVDKEPGVTSHDVVSACRKMFSTRRVGHAGTLDPMATGVLVIGVERATKLLGLLTLDTKSYAATIRLGAATTTDDREGEVISTADPSAVDDEQIAAGVAALTGDIEQVPAKVSAIKVDGRRAHDRARAGEDFELPARPVTVSRFEIRDIRREPGAVDIDAEVDCSAGTYIRSLARDLGAALQVGGHLTALRRTASGPFTLDHALRLPDIADAPRLSLDLDEAIKLCFPQRAVDAAEAQTLSHGRWLEPVGLAGVYAAIDPDGRAVALIKESGRRASTTLVVRPANLN